MADPISGLLLPLVSAHLGRQTGTFTAAWGEGEIRVYLQSGGVTHFSGPSDILQPIAPPGTRLTGDFGHDLGALFGAGIPVAGALDAAAEALGRKLASLLEMPRARSGFIPGGATPEGAIPLPCPVPRMLTLGMKAVRGSAVPERVLRKFHGYVLRPANEKIVELLDASAARLFRQARGEPTLFGLISNFSGGAAARLDDAWRGIDLLLHLGALSLSAPAPKPAAPPVDYSARIAELRALAAELRGRHPFAALEIPSNEPVEKITRERIESAFRTVASRYHPDRLSGEAPEVREAAVEVFAVLQEKRASLEKPEVLKEAKDRQAVEARGEVYVSELDRERARVLFRKALAAERGRNWAHCKELVTAAISIDPLQPEYQLLSLFCEGLLKTKSVESVIAGIAALKFPQPRGQADAAWRQGWLLRLAGKNRDATDALKRAIQLVPDHAEAGSELRALQRLGSGKG